MLYCDHIDMRGMRQLTSTISYGTQTAGIDYIYTIINAIERPVFLLLSTRASAHIIEHVERPNERSLTTYKYTVTTPSQPSAAGKQERYLFACAARKVIILAANCCAQQIEKVSLFVRHTKHQLELGSVFVLV